MWNIKKVSIITLSLLFAISFAATVVHADPLEYKKDHPLGEDVVNVEQAVSSFENDLKASIKLPQFIPFEVTYSRGKYNTTDKSILVVYLNEKTGALMDVHVKQGEMPQKLTPQQKLIKMNVENDVGIFDYDDQRTFNFIYFYNKGLEYRVAISKRPVEFSQDTFTKVAESFK